MIQSNVVSEYLSPFSVSVESNIVSFSDALCTIEIGLLDIAMVEAIVISVVATIVQECSMAVVLMSYLTLPSCMYL